MSRTAEFGAESRGQTFMYKPEALTIVRDQSHPLYDPRVEMPLDQDLVDDIIERGVLVPILVRKNGERKGVPIIEVMDGRQRVRATIAANKKLTSAGKEPVRIPAIMRRDGDAETTMIVSNEYRTADDPVTKAQKVQRFMQHGHSEAETRKRFRLRGGELGELLSLLDAAPAVKQAVSDGAVSRTLVRDLVRLPEARQTELMTEVRENKEGAKKAKARVQQALIDAGNIPRPPKKPKGKPKAPVEEIASAWGIDPGALSSAPPDVCPRARKDAEKVRAKLLVLGARGQKKEWARGAADALAWILGDDAAMPKSVLPSLKAEGGKRGR